MRRRAVICFVGLGVLLLVGLRPAPASADQMSEGLRHLRQARAALDRAWDDKGGHKKTAMKRLDEAIDQVQAEMREPRRPDNDHRREGGRMEKRDERPRSDGHHDNRRRFDDDQHDNRRQN